MGLHMSIENVTLKIQLLCNSRFRCLIYQQEIQLNATITEHLVTLPFLLLIAITYSLRSRSFHLHNRLVLLSS